MASPWIDVSVTLRTGMVSWPGDPPARISHALDMERGDPCTVSLLEMGAAYRHPHGCTRTLCPRRHRD